MVVSGFRVIKEWIGTDEDGWNRVVTKFEVRDGASWRRALPEEATEIDALMRSRRTINRLG